MVKSAAYESIMEDERTLKSRYGDVEAANMY